ncbi:hypothetical protein GCM10009809_32140 [Isoptericola hypogeus]|uniref:Uncharacterized protein n=1 Tax=Isoptericola hypogeus TaxID=300179 RepID=A0ABP4VQ60_9MICO
MRRVRHRASFRPPPLTRGQPAGTPSRVARGPARTQPGSPPPGARTYGDRVPHEPMTDDEFTRWLADALLRTAPGHPGLAALR